MKPVRTLIIVLIAMKVILQFALVNSAYDLQRDEYLHLDQGLHLAWGYISVPPVTSWIAALIHIFGGGVFWVKFFPLLFGCLTLFLVCRIAVAMGGGFYSVLLAGTAFVLSPVLRLNILFQPNSLDVFAWNWVYYTLIRYFQKNEPRWLYWSAVAAAFGFLSKYNIAFLLAGLLPSMILGGQSKIFTNRHLYIAAFLGLLLITPNLIWQYQHQFPTLKQLRELQATQLVHVERTGFLKDQLLYFIGSLLLIIPALYGLLFTTRFRAYRFIAFSYLITLVLFTYMQAKSYYAMGLYPVLMAVGAVNLESAFSKPSVRWCRHLAVVLVLLIALPFILVGFPIKSPAAIAANASVQQKLGLLRWEDGKEHRIPQDFADMIGWKELAAKTDSAFMLAGARKNTLVLTDNYGEAGAVNYYSRFPHINAASYDADYINWIDTTLAINTVVRIYEPGEAEKDFGKLHELFDSVRVIGQISNPLAREHGTTVLLLQQPRVDLQAFIREDIRNHRKY